MWQAIFEDAIAGAGYNFVLNGRGPRHGLASPGPSIPSVGFFATGFVSLARALVSRIVGCLGEYFRGTALAQKQNLQSRAWRASAS